MPPRPVAQPSDPRPGRRLLRAALILVFGALGLVFLMAAPLLIVAFIRLTLQVAGAVGLI